MGLIIARWTNSIEDGIHYVRDDDGPWEGITLFAVMERYLTRGETMEILSYQPRDDEQRGVLMYNEREAHAWMEETSDD